MSAVIEALKGRPGHVSRNPSSVSESQFQRLPALGYSSHDMSSTQVKDPLHLLQILLSFVSTCSALGDRQHCKLCL